jgi:hypothetical protein
MVVRREGTGSGELDHPCTEMARPAGSPSRLSLGEESKNWYHAIGGYSVWGGGAAVVSEVGGQRQFGLDLQESDMCESHRQGLAQDFECIGSFKRRFTWTAGSTIPARQLHVPGGRA